MLLTLVVTQLNSFCALLFNDLRVSIRKCPRKAVQLETLIEQVSNANDVY